MESAGKWRTVWVHGAVCAGVLALVAAPVFTRGTGDWEQVYLTAANRLRTGGDVLALGSSYVYPPFGALFAVPFTFVSRTPGLIAWAIVNLVSVTVILCGAWRLTGGRGLPGRGGAGRGDLLAFWAGGFCALGFLLDAAANWQTDLIVAALIVVGCTLTVGGRAITAGVAFGTAAAFKCTPLLFAGYLLWKRRFAGAVALLAVAIGLNVLPDLIYPPSDGVPRLVVWKERMLTPMAGKDYDPGMWASSVAYNHSLAGVNLRWFAFHRIEANGQMITVARPDRLSATELTRLNLVLAAGLCLIALVAVWQRGNGRSESTVAELGLVISLMLLLSPMSSKPHFGILLLPQLVLVRTAWANRDRFLYTLAGVNAVGGLCAGKDVVGRTAYEFLMWNGLVFWLTVNCFLGCAYTRWRYGRAETRVECTKPPVNPS